MIIGVTGKIGSGKSTASKILSGMIDCVKVDVDEIAHELLWVKDRKIGELIFKNSELLKQIEDIIHPYVLNRIEELVKLYKFKNFVIEFPLLFHKKFTNFCHKTVMISVNDETIKKRLVLLRGYSEEDVNNRLKVYPIQWDYEFDHYVNNDYDGTEYLEQNIKKLMEEL